MTADFAESGAQAVVIIIGVVALVLALIAFGMRVRLAYQQGRAGR
ncbi:MAG TPA: hypothetical protein VJM33_11900 [Microthrixaceae bacterium]|nr:hypothetical protein [Microthrixaceae bacterium]